MSYKEALNSIVMYQGLRTELQSWKNLPKDEYMIHEPDEFESEDSHFIWMIALSLFGDWGTSIRHGWIYIEYEEEFHNWLDSICELSEEAYEINN